MYGVGWSDRRMKKREGQLTERQNGFCSSNTRPRRQEHLLLGSSMDHRILAWLCQISQSKLKFKNSKQNHHKIGFIMLSATNDLGSDYFCRLCIVYLVGEGLQPVCHFHRYSQCGEPCFSYIKV